MKLSQTKRTMLTNAEPTSQNFMIGDEGVIIEILRNKLYQNKVRTLVQEYISNARDAMREAGKDNQFVVTIPTKLSPTFRVRDFGIGISPDRMSNVFVKFGSSTKRGDNVQTGGLGLGAKSFWSYTDSFCVITFVDGVKRSYIAHIGSNSQGRLDLISTEDTQEPNGTEIQGAVKPEDCQEFKEAVFRTIYFWDEKPVIKGELDLPVRLQGIRVSDGVEVLDSGNLPGYIGSFSYYGLNTMAVVDGIPYPIERSLFEKMPNHVELIAIAKKCLVLHFGNGVVEVAANRESIADSVHTIEALEKIFKKSFFEISTFLSNSFGKCDSVDQFLKTYASLHSLFNAEKFSQYKDFRIENGYIKSKTQGNVRIVRISNLNRRKQKVKKITRSEIFGEKEIQLEHFNRIFFLDKEESKTNISKRIGRYMENNSVMYLIEPCGGWEADFETVKAGFIAKDLLALPFTETVKMPRTQMGATRRDKGEVCLHLTVGRSINIKLNDNCTDYFFVTLSDELWVKNSGELRQIRSFLKNSSIGSVEVCALSSRAESQVANDPRFTSLRHWIDSYRPTASDILGVKISSGVNSQTVGVISSLKGILDPTLTDMVKEYRNSMPRTSDVPSFVVNKVQEMEEFKSFKVKDDALAELVKSRYSLIEDLSYCYKKEEVVFYLNAKYEKGN